MSSLVASLIALALVIALMSPVLWAAVRPRTRAFEAALAATLAVTGGVAVAQSGVLAPRLPAWVTEEAIRTDPDTEKVCKELMPALREYGVLLADPRPGRLVVDREIWQQLPPSVQDVATLCAENDGAPAEVTFGPA
jgi:hypothetical protein